MFQNEIPVTVGEIVEREGFVFADLLPHAWRPERGVRPERVKVFSSTEPQMRICSLLPSATEIAYAIGLGDSVLGVTHECDFPPEAAKKPSLLRPRVDPHAPPAEIDRQVSELIARGESIYAVDAELLVRFRRI